ncbi:MAG: FxLYD domain-containing protein, partial [Nitrososphaeraceae archaeon]
AGDVINTKYLEITNHSFSEDLLFTIVNGTIVNNSNNTINSAEVSIQFYDVNDTLITSSTENAKFVILAPGENSSFSVRSDLGDEIPNSYTVIPGGDIQVG